MGQLKITMPDDLRAKLDQASAKSSLSVAEEIRSRIERTFQEDAADRPTRELMDTVQKLAELVCRQTWQTWYDDEITANLLCEAITHRLLRLFPRIGGAEQQREKIPDNQLPADRPVMSDDQHSWSASLEAIEWYARVALGAQVWAVNPKSGELMRPLRMRRK